MNKTTDEDLQLGDLLQSWPTPDCDPDFASHVVQRALNERVVTLPAGKRRLMIPLLLAACLLSAGAWASWEAHLERTRDVVPLGVSSESPHAPSAPSRVSFQIVSGIAHAEPEPATPPPALPPQKPISSTQTVKQPDAPPPPEQPQKVHLPRCECGISAIVCSCSD